jgi:hypothetical protein
MITSSILFERGHRFARPVDASTWRPGFLIGIHGHATARHGACFATVLGAVLILLNKHRTQQDEDDCGDNAKERFVAHEDQWGGTEKKFTRAVAPRYYIH